MSALVVVLFVVLAGGVAYGAYYVKKKRRDALAAFKEGKLQSYYEVPKTGIGIARNTNRMLSAREEACQSLATP